MLNKFYSLLLICLATINSLFSSESSYVTELSDAQFDHFIQTADKPVIVDFWASWCGPCMQMKPIFLQLAKELNDQYIFVSVNTEKCRQIARKHQIKSLPTIKIMRKVTVLGTYRGYTSKENLKNYIDYIMGRKMNQDISVSKIQEDAKELVAECLTDKHIDDELRRQRVLECKQRAIHLLELFNSYDIHN